MICATFHVTREKLFAWFFSSILGRSTLPTRHLAAYSPRAILEGRSVPDDPRSNNQLDHQDAPTYWFAVLEIARERGDFSRAAEAQRQLERLGVRVRYGRRQAKGVAHAS